MGCQVFACVVASVDCRSPNPHLFLHGFRDPVSSDRVKSDTNKAHTLFRVFVKQQSREGERGVVKGSRKIRATAADPLGPTEAVYFAI